MLDFVKTQKLYRNLIENDLMRFWEKAFDTEYGGIYTCYTNDGTTRLSDDKYVWSQGRMLWVLSRLCEMHDRGIVSINRQNDQKQADKTYRFLLEHALLDGEGVCAYLLTRDGNKKESIPGKGYYTSYFVDCFVLMGFMEYGRVFGYREPIEKALAIYDKMMGFLNRGDIRSEPYPVMPGIRAHSLPMILCNVCDVCVPALRRFDHPRAQELADAGRRYASETLTKFFDPGIGMVREMISDNPAFEDSVLLRHLAPGHTLEDMWFCMDMAGGDPALEKRIYSLVETGMEIGWDSQYGGLFRFIDIAGGSPRGKSLDDPYEKLLVDTWDTKLWWVHSEALYVTLRSYLQTGSEMFLKLYQKLEEYVFNVFPNPNRDIGEWIQIRSRDGKPLNKVVALPVKDPYHILRNSMLILEQLT